jgi:hypothetical protein
MSLVDNGSATHWPPIIRVVSAGMRQVAPAIVCWFTEALWNPMTMEFALTQALLKPGGGVHLRP